LLGSVGSCRRPLPAIHGLRGTGASMHNARLARD
jgi:hypothetical protein